MKLDTILYPCPYCGFVVFSAPTGSYDTCPLCGWEDDNVQLRYPGLAGGANGESLWEAQQRTLAKMPLTLLSNDDFMRDRRWRPLRAEEALEAELPMPMREVRNTADVLTTLGSGTWTLAAKENPINTLDYYWLRHD